MTQHTIVYADRRMYAGWPANHGAWQWGDQFLVGFLRGPFDTRSPMHHIREPFERVFARSHDGGQTWRVEQSRVDPPETEPFACHAQLNDPPPVFYDSRVVDGKPRCIADTIFRVSGVYDHGGDFCDEGGGWYMSSDCGVHWLGPYPFNGLEWKEGEICTARTRVLHNLMFLSAGQRDIWGTDYTFCARFYTTGRKCQFEFVSIVLADEARAVMPAVAEVEKRVVVAMRRRKSGRRGGWIDAVFSDDHCQTWSKPRFVADTGSHNGNPPALLTLQDGRLLCAYGNRDEGSICYSLSEDGGESWPTSGVIRQQKSKSPILDIGYPQLFLRSDGTPICVYYWSDDHRVPQHIAASEVEVLR